MLAPWPRDALASLVMLPITMAVGWYSWEALDGFETSTVVEAALAWAAWLGGRWWLRLRSIGLAIGRNAPG